MPDFEGDAAFVLVVKGKPGGEFRREFIFQMQAAKCLGEVAVTSDGDIYQKFQVGLGRRFIKVAGCVGAFVQDAVYELWPSAYSIEDKAG